MDENKKFKKYKDFERSLPPEKRWENLDISNDFIFCHIMQDKELFAELLRRILPDIKICRVEHSEYQKTLRENIDTRGVRFDVYAVSDSGTKIYDVEMQNVNDDNLPKRARYYHSNMTANIMNRDTIDTYDDLPSEFVIFICKFDLFNMGRHIYTFKNFCCEDKNLQLGDGATTIFLNAKGLKDDVLPELKNFLNFVMGRTSEDPFIKRLERNLDIAKHNSEWRMNYMTMLMNERITWKKGLIEGERRGLIKGERRGLIEGERRANFSTAKKMLHAGLTISDIIKFTGLSPEDLNSL